MVGLSLLVVRGGEILLSKRKGSHGAGEYGTPGGHMEHGETPEEGILRELAEECGTDIKVSDPRFMCVSNMRAYMPQHYIDLGYVAHVVGGHPVDMEPDKSEGWEWHPLSRLPDGRTAWVDNLVIAYQTGQKSFGD